MLFNNSKTSFKIGGTVGIIILLLGITVLFGVFQMSKVSQEIIEISEEYVPLNEIMTDIRHDKSNQALNFEKILRFEENNDFILMEKAKEGFWLSGGSIDADISRGKNIIQTGIQFSSEENEPKLQNLFQRFSDFERNYYEYESLIREVFLILGSNESQEKDFILDQIQRKEIQLQDDLSTTIHFLSLYTDEATSNIESNEKDSLIGQILIVLVVGAMAATLGFFINQINKDLKKEVDTKTVELQKANGRLRELDKMKDEFIGIASHELKSPIQPIFGFAELAKSGDIDQKEAWEGVIQLATKLQDLANDLLDVSKIESNRLKIHYEKFRINDFLLDIIQTLKINLKDEVLLEEDLDENIMLEADKTRFGQVLRNIFSNALKFTPKGKIKIETRVLKNENKVIFKISDSGKGIPNEILPRIFEKFVTKGSPHENQSGTGLGLFLCKGIINAHGGEISARNNSDRGATLEFSLPIVNDPKIQKPVQIFTN